MAIIVSSPKNEALGWLLLTFLLHCIIYTGYLLQLYTFFPIIMMNMFRLTDTSEGMEMQAEPDESVNKGLRDLVETKPIADSNGGVKMRKMTRIGDMTIQDHFTLSNPSSHVMFADDEAMVFVDNLEQITLEKKKDNGYIVAKQGTIGSPGIMMLRLAYTLIAFLMAGFVFVFCIQIVLFLFLGLAIESGKHKAVERIFYDLWNMLPYTHIICFTLSSW